MAVLSTVQCIYPMPTQPQSSQPNIASSFPSSYSLYLFTTFKSSYTWHLPLSVFCASNILAPCFPAFVMPKIIAAGRESLKILQWLLWTTYILRTFPVSVILKENEILGWKWIFVSAVPRSISMPSCRGNTRSLRTNLQKSLAQLRGEKSNHVYSVACYTQAFIPSRLSPARSTNFNHSPRIRLLVRCGNLSTQTYCKSRAVAYILLFGPEG